MRRCVHISLSSGHFDLVHLTHAFLTHCFRRSVTVAGYARGKVAAGMTVKVSITVLARRQGPLLELLPVVAEDGTTEVTIRAEVRTTFFAWCSMYLIPGTARRAQ